MTPAQLLSSLILALAAPLHAQLTTLPSPASQPAAHPSTAPAPKLTDKLSVTEHEMTLAGQPLRYKASAGYMPVKDEAGKEKASFFYVAYEKLPAAEARSRGITFVFNGGPGAAAVWLHLGALGPKRIELKNDAGDPPAPPYRLVDNDSTWLDLTDLVFIDPVGTGYSRPAAGEKGESFFGVNQDVASVADFIRLYLTRFERWPSPKFLAGESYGTTRAAALSEYLVDRYGIALNGIAFISSVLNFQTLDAAPGNDLPYILYLPSYTAAAWYHKKLAPELQEDLPKTLKEVEQFALGDYAAALFKGPSAISAEQRKAIAEKLARYTSLPAAWLERVDLRVGPGEFRKMLLADSRRILGRYDDRITAFDAQPASSVATYDPSFTPYLAVYSATFNDYIRRELRYENDLPYEVLSNKVQPWDWSRGHGGSGGYLNVATDLRSALLKVPGLKVLFASGYFDLATPYLGTIHTVNHLDLAPDVRANVMQTYYPGGHMMYHNREALAKLKEDVKRLMSPAGK